MIAAAEPALASGNFYAGRSFGDSSANKGSFFLRLKPWNERGGGRNSSRGFERIRHGFLPGNP